MTRATKAAKKEKRWTTPDYAKKIIALGKKAKSITVSIGKDTVYLGFNRACFVGIPKINRNLVCGEIYTGIGITREQLEDPATYSKGEEKGTWVFASSFSPDFDALFPKITTNAQLFPVQCELSGTPMAVFCTDLQLGFINTDFKDVLTSIDKNNILSNGTPSGMLWTTSEDRVLFGAMPFLVSEEKKSRFLEDFHTLGAAGI